MAALIPRPAASSSAKFTHTRDHLEYEGEKLVIHEWRPNKSSEREAAVVCFHGYGSHACYPTLRYASELLAEANNVVYSLDLKGHGESPGLRGLISSSADLTEMGVAMTRWVRAKEPKRKLVLLGVSMGGAIALNVCRKVPEHVDSAILVAPMLGIANLPPAWQQWALRGLAFVVPGAAVLGSNASDPSAQYADEDRRAECVADDLQYHGSMRLASAAACLDTATELAESFEEIRTPFLCLAAEKDIVVDPKGAKQLMDRSVGVTDKRLVTFVGALHGLLCEPVGVRSKVEKEILQWVKRYRSS